MFDICLVSSQEQSCTSSFDSSKNAVYLVLVPRVDISVLVLFGINYTILVIEVMGTPNNYVIGVTA